MMEKWHFFNQMFLDPDELLRFLDSSGNMQQVDPAQVRLAEIKVNIRASLRMRSRQFMLQSAPLIFQTFLNPVFMQTLAQVNQKKVNVESMGRALEDMTGYRDRYGSFFVPLTPQEQQMLNQPSPQDVIRMQMQRERIAGQADIAEQGQAADILKSIIERTADAMAQPDTEEDTGESEGGGSRSAD